MAIASEEPGESAWYHARVVLIDASAGTDRTLFESDVQLGWISSSPTGDVVAVVEAVCSDRLVVAGDLLLIDPASGEVRRPDTLGVDVAFLSWRADGILVATGVRGLETVVLEVDVSTGIAKERWATREAGEGFFLAAAPVGDDVAITLNSAARPPELVVVSGHDPRTIVSTANDGTDDGAIDHRLATGAHLDRVRRPGDPGPPDVATRRRPVPVDPQRPRRAGVGVRRFLAGHVHGVPAVEGVRAASAEPSRLVGAGTGLRIARSSATWGAPTRWICSPASITCWRWASRIPKRIGVLGGSYGGFMAALLPVSRSAVRRRRVDLAGHRLVLRAVRQQPRRLGAGLPGRRPCSTGRSTIGSGARSSWPNGTGRLRCSRRGCEIERPRSARPPSSTGRCASAMSRRIWRCTRSRATASARSRAIFDLVTRTVAWFERFMPPGPTAR